MLGIALIVLGGATLPILVGADKEAVEKSVKPSIFRQDKDGVLWFEQGDDGETKYSAAMILSAKTDGIVIVVIANKKHIKDAVGLAIKMRNVLQKNKDTPDHIPVVAFEDSSFEASYRFYTDAMYVGKDKFGLYGPAEAKKMLSKVVTQHQLLKRYVKEGKWGKDHATAKPLQVISK